MSSRRFPIIRSSVVSALVVAALAAGGPVFADRAYAAQGTLVSACFGTIGCPEKINLRGPVDSLTFQALLTPASPLSPATEPFTITLRNANGVVFTATLPAGSLKPQGRRFQFRDPNARVTGGFTRVTVRPKGSNWRITVIARGTMSGATLAPMTVELQLGDDTFATVNTWSKREYGWLLHLPGGPTPPPTPSPTPVVTPSATPTSSPTPAPTPTENPYGSVFEAFVNAPASLLR